MPINITPLRIAANMACLLAALFIWLNIRDYWPIFGSAQHSLLAFGAAIALLILLPATQAGLRLAIGLLIGLALLAGSALALRDPMYLAMNMVDSFQYYKQAGYSFLQCLSAATANYETLSPLAKSAIHTGLVLGLPVPLVLLMIVLNKVIPDSTNRRASSGPWQAKWLSGTETTQLALNSTGLPLGLRSGGLFTRGGILRYQPNQRQGWRAGHHAAIAGTRAGKGVSVVLPAILDHDGPVVALDIKGENFAVTRRYRESLGRRVIVLNPFSVIEPTKYRYNPLNYIRHAHMVRDIDVITEGLVRPERGNGAHFADMAKTLIAAAIEHVFMTSDNPNLVEVMDLLFGPEFTSTMEDWAASPSKVGVRVTQAANAILATGENERGAIKTTIKRAFDWARSDEMRDFLKESNCSMYDIFSNVADLFIVVPLDQVDAQAVFMRLFSNIILGHAVREQSNRRTDKNVLLVLDEFVRLGRMEKLVNIANVAAGAGIEVLFITQDKGQIEAVYGVGDTASLLGSCVTIRIFGLGRAENGTAKWAAEALGDQTVHSRTKQPNKFGEANRYSISEQAQKLMTADQILEMKSDEMLLLTGSKKPARIKRIISHKHPAYKRKLDRNPLG